MITHVDGLDCTLYTHSFTHSLTQREKEGGREGGREDRLYAGERGGSGACVDDRLDSFGFTSLLGFRVQGLGQGLGFRV